MSAFLAPALPASAGAALQVTPVMIEVPAGSQVATVDVKNQDAKPTPIQMRVFRWRQSDGEEKLEPTQDVAASPPIGNIAPHSTLNIRLIRVSNSPVASEEAYRLVIDQLPQGDQTGRARVSMLLRQVLPVFFEPADRSPPNVSWSIVQENHRWLLRARNAGDRRLRVAKVILSGAGGSAALGGGLLGYVLGHSEMSWPIPARRGSFKNGGRVTVRGESDAGVLNAVAMVAAR